jgi:hypothetical protein
MRMLLSAALALPLLTSASFVLLPATPATARPQQVTCVITTYYNNAAHEDEVGTRSACPGSPVLMTGHSSPYHTSEREVVDVGWGGHQSGDTTINLPCEFLQAGCSNLPVRRYQ